MLKTDLFNLQKGIQDCNNLIGVKFAYALAKNLDIINREIEVIKATIEPKEKFKEYDNKRMELAKKYAKQENGNPVITQKVINGAMQTSYEIENKEEFNKEWELLKKEYKKEIEQRDLQIKELEQFLQTEIKLKLFKIKIDDVPQNISVEQMLAIKILIE